MLLPVLDQMSYKILFSSIMAPANKTRKNMKLPKHIGTMHGLNEWHESLHEKLGWMVLAKAKGYTKKIQLYKESLQHFLDTVTHVSSEYKNSDKKHDLNVLKMNVECLRAFVMKHL